MFPINCAPKDNVSILGWFPKCRCWFTMVWDKDAQEWQSFGGQGSFYGELPTGWIPCPHAPQEEENGPY